MYVETTYNVHFRGLLKLRYLPDTGMISSPASELGRPHFIEPLPEAFSCHLFERRPFLLFPVVDGLLIALLSPALRFLQALPQSLEQTTHMSRVVADPKLFADHYGYPLTRPYLSSKAVSLGSPFQKLGYLGALLLAQAGPCSRSGSAF
jgi:hypothetical protein